MNLSFIFPMDYLLLFLSSSVSTLLGFFFIFKYFPKWGLLDRPHDYGLKRAALPYSAGVIISIVFISHLLLFFPITKELLGLICSGLIIVTVSFIDDFKRLKPSFRLLMQFLAGLILVLSGIGIEVISNPFGSAIDLRMWTISFEIFSQLFEFTPLADLFTIVWIIFVMNAINFQDGIPGLVSGIGSIASFTLLGLSILLIISTTTTLDEKLNAQYVAKMALILGSILFVFNRFDFYPPKVVIGDSGAMFIGFILAVLSLYTGGKIATTFIVLGLPLADLLWVIIRRVSKGQSPFQGDLNHYHHKLLRVGFSEQHTLLIAYMMTFALGIASIGFLFYLKTFGKMIAIAAIILLMFVISMLLIKKESRQLKEV
ncbi:MAG: MraY family glycosyltransferase [Candidatus Gracilibacteria bacterium]